MTLSKADFAHLDPQVRITRLRTRRQARDFEMWVGMLTREFTDPELAALARHGLLSEEDGWALKAAGRVNPLRPRPAPGMKP